MLILLLPGCTNSSGGNIFFLTGIRKAWPMLLIAPAGGFGKHLSAQKPGKNWQIFSNAIRAISKTNTFRFLKKLLLIFACYDDSGSSSKRDKAAYQRRTEERRVRKECVSTGRTRGWP